MFDNSLIGWLVDDDMQTDPPFPIAIGSLPPEAADTAPVLSPQWALVENDAVVLVPDKFRGTVDRPTTWLATNNGATRKINAPILACLTISSTPLIRGSSVIRRGAAASLRCRRILVSWR